MNFNNTVGLTCLTALSDMRINIMEILVRSSSQDDATIVEMMKALINACEIARLHSDTLLPGLILVMSFNMYINEAAVNTGILLLIF